ncbi:MAG: recombinase family protein [Velocimicrobium sp.]
MNEEKQRNQKVAALYIRVSTDKQEELSPESQKDKLLEYAMQNKYLVPNEFVFWELGISGRTAKRRPEFQRMIGIAKDKSHPFDAILVWKYSRFARNQEESIVYKSMLKKDNVDVVSVSEYISDDVFGKLIERIIEWMDEYYSIRLSGDVFRGMHKRAELGGYQASPPLGYQIAIKGKPPVIDKPNAKIIQSIFHMYVDDHMSIYAIAIQLNKMGFTTKSGNLFQKRSIEYILKNIHYCGYTRWNVTNNATKQIKDEKDWIITKGDFEPIISEYLYNAAKDRLENEYRPYKSKPVYNQKHWLSGMVKCSACGRSLTIGFTQKKNTEKKYFYLQCYGYHKGLCKISHHISMLKIEPIILDAIKYAYQTGDFDYELAHKCPSPYDDHERILSQLKKLSEKEERVKQAYIDGIDSLSEYKINKNVLRNDQLSLMDLLKKSDLQAKYDATNPVLQHRIKGIYSVLASNDFSYDEKAVAIRTIIQKIVFQKELNRVDIYFLYR